MPCLFVQYLFIPQQIPPQLCHLQVSKALSGDVDNKHGAHNSKSRPDKAAFKKFKTELADAKLDQGIEPEYFQMVQWADLAKPAPHPDLADDGAGAAA